MRFRRHSLRWGSWEWHDSPNHHGCAYEYRTCQTCGEKSTVRYVRIHGQVFDGRTHRPA